MYLQYSDNGTDWTTVESFTPTFDTTIEIEDSIKAKYWRIYTDTILSSSTKQLVVHTVQFYGR